MWVTQSDTWEAFDVGLEERLRASARYISYWISMQSILCISREIGFLIVVISERVE